MIHATEEKTWRLKHQATGEKVEWTREQILAEINRDRSDTWPVYDAHDPWMHALEHWTDWRFLPEYRLRIVQDEAPEEPRWDPITKFATWCDRYTIGDEQPKCTPQEWLIGELSEEAQDEWERFKEEDLPSCPSGCSYNDPVHREWERVTDQLEKAKLMELVEKEFFVLPVFAYNHSGITISTGSLSCPWDSGQIGWIILSREKAKEELGPDCDPYDFMRTEIKVYDVYLQGDVWGYIVEEKSGAGDWEEVDSCWGFYGEDLDELRPDMDDHLSKDYGLTDEDWERAWDDRQLGN